MKLVRVIVRVLIPFGLVMLAACQTAPVNKDTATAAPEPAAETTLQAGEQGAPVAVYLADTVSNPNWTPVQIQAGTLYVNPQPILTRDDLTGVKAGTNKQGDGLLALELNDSGKQKVSDITSKNPNKRLALVVGQTMMAAPSYTTTVTTGQLVFPVGTEENATAAARAIAGVASPATPVSGAATTPATDAATGTSPGVQPAR